MSSPATGKKKKDAGDKEKKKWRGFGSSMSKIFYRRDSDKRTDRDDDIEETTEEDTSPSPTKRRTNTVLVQTGSADSIKPPLPRPRSLTSITVDDAEKNEEKEEKEESKPSEKTKPQFGLLPTELAERYPDEPVPEVLVTCIDVLKADIRREGIFRIPGRMTSILAMKDSFEGGKGLVVEEPNSLDIAGLVSQFFRELPEPLLTYDLYYNWIEAVKLENEEKIRDSLKEMLIKIPKPNFNTLKYFIEFLALVGKNSGANRMGTRNLALVFGASLLNPPSIDQYDLENIKLQCSVIEHMITGYSYIFEGVAEPEQISQKVRERAVATIPAGNPNAAAVSAAQPPQDRRKGFMKRKSTFFSMNHGSSASSRISDMIIPTARSVTKPQGDTISVTPAETEKDSLSPDEIDKKEKNREKKEKKQKKTKKKEKKVEPAETNADPKSGET